MRHPDAAAVGREHREPLARRLGDQSAHQVGQQHLALAATLHRVPELGAHSRGEAPQIHRHQCRRVEESRFPAVTGPEHGVVAGDDAPALLDLDQAAARPGQTDAAGHRRRTDDGAPQPEPDQRVVRVGARQMRPQDAESGGSVEVVGVGDAEGTGALDLGPRRQHCVDRAPRDGLQGEPDVDCAGPVPLDVVPDRLAGLVPDDEHNRCEPRRERVAGHEVDDGLAPRSDRGQGLQSPVTDCSPGRQDHQDRAGAACGHAPQRRTALAQLMPPPKPVSNSRSPLFTRPVSRA